MRDPDSDVSMLYRPRYLEPLIRIGQYGLARTIKTLQEPGRYPVSDLDAPFVTVEEPTVVTQLQTQDVGGGDWETWMVDEPGHWLMLESAADQMVGPNVFVAGLGLGLIVNLLLKRGDIDSIVVVERNYDVIRLMRDMAPWLRSPRVAILNDDFWEWRWRGLHWGLWSSFFIDLWRGPMDVNLPDVLDKDQQLAVLFPRVPRVMFTFQRALAVRRALDEITNRNLEDD